MVICRWCKKTIVNAGNPAIIYSNCSDCHYSQNKDGSTDYVIPAKRKERLDGRISKVPKKRKV